MSSDDAYPPGDENAPGDDNPDKPNSEDAQEPSKTEMDSAPHYVDRWTLVRDVTLFQGKLLLDGARDVILSPISIAAAVVALLKRGDQPGRQFYDLLYMGKRSERWINLFGATDHVSPPSFHNEDAESVDVLVDRLEAVARRQYEKGGLTKTAKQAVDKALDAVDPNHRRSHRQRK